MASFLSPSLMPAPGAALNAAQARIGALAAALRSAMPVERDLVVVEYDKRDGQLYGFDQQHNDVIGPLNVGGGGAGYVLPVATDTRLGGIKKGPGFEVIGSGVLEHDARSLPLLP